MKKVEGNSKRCQIVSEQLTALENTEEPEVVAAKWSDDGSQSHPKQKVQENMLEIR